jgi:ABC-2 type transport system permease protein
MSNPITVAVEMFHEAFWAPVVPEDKRIGWPPEFMWNIAGSIALIVIVTIIGQLVFRRFERTFAQDL